ncbi:MAG: hypothetical protein EOS76_11845 [Mesorhizobium sp.]|uniref:COG3904 family protein n=1 Tax=unclassified Mesorhizobium TaxID=325217 RepID=UPI000F74C161|nr:MULTISPECIES: hypothetical protein [unclassified Mesorhizobium]AZO35493.1 hypothetical protein EJ072_14225 [Mesorhizobium sp. M2A.F.Ca.ET.046.03.2.1]RVC71720.1 hypothetical protein EN766_25945 [Mesorhizobium sp. M2A.F.Ca.ET.046.02.1.1]RWB45842.1 MAG: hypothetical protein EOQ44_10655 [Mesorhizobium sp.]RWE19484.1 MAG: hypothetical protein EOS76_11845 [Mesorhizobium sp.]
MLIAPHAGAIEFSMERGNATSKILVTGPIERGDAQRFKDYWEKNAYDSWHFVVSFDSPGGNLLDGLEIGRFLRKVGAGTEVQRYPPSDPDHPYPEGLPGAECYSACALAFMGGVERNIPEGGTIGFHQFYGGAGSSTDEAMELTQQISALIAGYLREMGAKPELFEIMSGTSPGKMFVPTRDEIAALNIVPQPGFHDFQLVPKNGLIVATATDERNPGPLERVYEIETMCWKRRPIINLYAKSDQQGLAPEIAAPSTTHIDGFRIDTDFGTFEYGSDRLKLYPQTRLLASLILEPKVARALGSGNAMVVVNSYTASGVLMGGKIVAPSGGDPAIIASFRDCL